MSVKPKSDASHVDDSPVDDSLVASIIDELKRGGALRDPRPPQTDRTPLEAYAACEVQHSIDRIRMLRTHEPPPEVNLVTIADYRKAVRLLRQASAALSKVALFDDHRRAVPEMERISRELDRVHQTPPARADELKHHCASEALDLMTFFSATAPTGTELAPFRTIAALLYEAVTRKPYTDVDMKRACDLVLRDRKQFDPNAFKRA